MSGGTPWTAGPWAAGDTRYNRDFRTCLNVMTQDGLRFVAAVSCDPHTDTAQLVANARLIAAAPEMAEALNGANELFIGGGWSDAEYREKLRESGLKHPDLVDAYADRVLAVRALLTKIGASQ